MYTRLKIPIQPTHKLFSALIAQGYGNQKEKQNSVAENRKYRVLRPDLNLKIKFDRVFDLKGGDVMK
jgi:hypothetical protein